MKTSELCAMILCAGYGTRLNDLTRNTPKPMLKIGSKPLLEHTITHLKLCGIKKFVINLHYLAEQITDYFGDGKDFGVEIVYSYEEAPLGTAGAVKKVKDVLCEHENFLVLYADIVTNQNYTDLMNFHISKPCAVGSIILHDRSKSNSIVEMDENNKIIKFLERPSMDELLLKRQNWVNSGLYCFNKKVLGYIPDGFSDFPKDIFPRLIKDEALYGLPLSGYRTAVDSTERYFMIKLDYEKGVIWN